MKLRRVFVVSNILCIGIAFMLFAVETKTQSTQGCSTLQNVTNCGNKTRVSIEETQERICHSECHRVKNTVLTCKMFQRFCQRLDKEDVEVNQAIRAINIKMKCKSGHRYCPIKSACLPAQRTCKDILQQHHGGSASRNVSGTVQKNNTEMKSMQQKGYCMALCSKEKKFCLEEMKCIPFKRKCSFDNLKQMIRSGYNDSNGRCPGSATYCPVLSRCVKDHAMCNPCTEVSAKIERNCTDDNKTCSVMWKQTLHKVDNCLYSCSSEYKFCPKHSKCIPKDSNCVNFISKEANIPNQYKPWHEFCSSMHYTCPRAKMFMDDRAKVCTKVMSTKSPMTLEEVIPREVSVLPKRITYEEKRDLREYFRQQAQKCIALIGNDEKAIWVLKKRSGLVRIPMKLSLTRAFVICFKNEKLQLEYKPVKDSYHGVITLKFVLLDTMPSKSFVKIKGEKAWIGHLYSIIQPKVIVPELEITQNQTDLVEDTEGCIPIEVRKTIVMKMVKVVISSNIPKSLLQQLSRAAVSKYLLYVEELKTMKTTLVVIGSNADYTRDGRFFISKRTARGYSQWGAMPGRISIKRAFAISQSDRICFRPRPDFCGLIRLKFATKITTWRKIFIRGRVFKAFFSYTSCKPATHHIFVRNVNDPPMILRGKAFLPPLPHNFDPKLNHGFLISSLKTDNDECDMTDWPFMSGFHKDEPLSMDPDGNPSGIVILDCPKSNVGHYEFKVVGSNWKKCVIPKETGSLSTVILLSPDARLRYVPAMTKAMTMVDTVTHNARIRFMAWDGSDGLRDGYHRVKVAFTRTGPYSKKEAYGVVLKKGCDGVCDSKKVLDECGVCGGDGATCLSCDGMKNSNATIDQCGDCTGGKTGKTYNYRMNCHGSCNNDYYKDECGKCQHKRKKYRVKDCNGDCFGKAVIRCGKYCVGGKTGKPLNYGRDICGVCDGDNSTCSLCDSKLELSGKCDMKLKLRSPQTILSSQSMALTFTGFNMGKYKTAKCHAIGMDESKKKTELGNANLVHSKQSWFMYQKAPGFLPQGESNFKCTFDDDEKIHDVMGSLTVYPGKIKVDSVMPTDIEFRKKTKILVKGSGFRDLKNLMCLLNNKFKSKAYYVNSSNVYCMVSSTHPMVDTLWLDVILGQERKEEMSITMMKGKRIKVYSERPYPLSARFTWSFNRAHIRISKPWIALNTKAKTSCALFFNSSTVKMFGNRHKCYFNRRRPYHIFIWFGKDSSITSESALYFNNTFMITREKFPLKQNKKANEPLYIKAPMTNIIAKLKGPSTIAICKKAKYDGSHSTGGAGKSLKYSWTMALIGKIEDLTEKQRKIFMALKKDVQGAKTSHIFLSGSKLIPGKRHKLTLCVRNIVRKAGCAHQYVKREEEEKLQFDLGSKSRVVKVAKEITEGLRKRPSFPGCTQSSLSEEDFYYSWEVDDTTVTVYGRNHRHMKVKKGSLKPNKRYNITLTVMLKSNPKIKAVGIKQWIAKGSHLKARILGGSRTVPCHSTLRLDASRSNDPDKTKEMPIYEWDCMETSGTPCQFKTGKGEKPPLSAGRRLSIATGTTLKCNNSYIFQLKYRKGKRSSQSVVRIRIKDDSVPGLSISSRASRNKKTVYVHCNFSSDSDAKLSWMSTAREGVVPLDFNDKKVFRTKPRIRHFKKPKHLKRISKKVSLSFRVTDWMYGESINIGCKVENKKGNASASTDVELHSPPIAGNFSVEPKEGNALETKFSLFAEGWEASNGNDSLLYTFGYLWPKDRACKKFREVLLISADTENAAEEISLPPGCAAKNHTLTLFVKATNEEGASTKEYFKVKVLRKLNLFNEVEKKTDENNILVQEKDFDAATREALTAVHYVESMPNGVEEKQTSTKKIIESAIKLATSILQQVTEPKIITKALQIAVSATNRSEGGEVSDPKVTESFAQSMVRSLIFDAGNIKTEKVVSKIKKVYRGRREAGYYEHEVHESDSEYETLSSYEAHHIAEVFDNIINEREYDDFQDRLKGNYTTAIVYLSRLLCAELVTENEELILKSRMGSLSVVLKPAEHFSWLPHELSYSEHQKGKRAQVLLGRELERIYEQWNCTEDECSCSDVCIASAQYQHDIFSKDDNSSRVTDIASIAFFNPETRNPLQNQYSRKAIQYKLPLYDKVTADNKLQCCLWNKQSGVWSETNCTIAVDWNKRVALCNCSELGQVTVFERIDIGDVTTTEPDVVVQKEIVIEERVSSTTEQSTISTPLSMPSTTFTTSTSGVSTSSSSSKTSSGNKEVLSIELKLPYDFNTHVRQSAIPALQEEVISKISTALQIPQIHIQNIRFEEGSIIIKLDIRRSVNEAEINLTSVSLRLQEVVKAGSLSFSFSGSMLEADPTYVQMHISQEGIIPTTKEIDTKIKKKDEGMSVAKIILIIVCLCIVATLGCLIARWYLVQKAKRIKVMPDRPWTPMEDLKKGTLVHVNSVQLPEKEMPARNESWASLRNPYYGARLQLHGISGKTVPTD